MTSRPPQSVAGRILQPHYDVALAADTTEAHGKLIGGLVDLLVCDIHLPRESGMDLIERLLARADDDLAVVMVTGEDSPELAERAFELGAYGYLVKPYRRGDLLITVSNALRRRQLEQQARSYQRELEQDVVMKSLETERMRQLLLPFRGIPRALAARNRSQAQPGGRDARPGDGHHLSRMGGYREELSRRLELSAEVCDSIGMAAQMHDIGKIAVPDHILLKTGPLTDEERGQMQIHTEIGKQILQGSESPLLQLAESIAWTHHEKIDGSGYPRGLRGDEIPIEGRVAAVADVFDAVTRDRPYREAMGLAEAMALMAEGRESHFDAVVLDAFMAEIPSMVS